jgi:hypothetical protein
MLLEAKVFSSMCSCTLFLNQERSFHASNGLAINDKHPTMGTSLMGGY